MNLFVYLCLLSMFSSQNNDCQSDLFMELDNRVYNIVDIEGDLNDIKNFFFLDTAELSNLKRGINIKYIKELNTFYFSRNEVLLAYYHANIDKDSVIIDNFSIVNGSVSFINTQEREFLMKLSNNKEKNTEFSSYTMKIFNSDNCKYKNKLKGFILISFRE